MVVKERVVTFYPVRTVNRSSKPPLHFERLSFNTFFLSGIPGFCYRKIIVTNQTSWLFDEKPGR
jgi:hypothetical protein